MLPPSTTDGSAVRVTVVVSIESVIVVVAGAGLVARFSKLPPVALVIVVLTVEPLLDVVGRRFENYSSAGLARFDVDRLAVAQGNRHSRLRWIGQRSGVSDIAAFNDRWVRRQGDGGGVDRIGNRGGRWRRVGRQVLEVTASGVGDRRVDGRAVVIDVVGWSFENYSPAGFASFDVDRLTVAQRDRHSGLRWVGQRCGVSDIAALNNRVIGSQGNGSGINRISDRGDRRCSTRHQVLKVTASCTCDRRVDGRTVVIDVVGRSFENYSSAGLARFDVDRLAV